MVYFQLSKISLTNRFIFVEIQFYKDEEFYDRLFTGIFLYFCQYQPRNPDWYAIVIYDTHSRESEFPVRYRALRETHLRCFYLDELGAAASESLGLLPSVV